MHSTFSPHGARTRRLLLAGAAAASALVLVACGNSTGDSGGVEPTIEEIRVGLVFPTSGAFATLGTDQANGVKLALDWANDNGGIDGVPITIFEADSQSDPAVGATVAQRLIDQEDVDILIGSYGSGIAQAILPIAQRNDVILWEVGAVSPAVNADGNTNFLRTVGSSSTYAAADIDFIENYLADQFGEDASDLRIAIAHEDGAFGSSVAEAIELLADERGLNIVANEAYPLTSTDLTPVVLRLKDAEPDILLMTPLVADTMLFWEQAKTQDFNVPVVIGSAGFSSASFLEKFGEAGVEGVFDVEAPAIEYMNSDALDPEVKELLDTWRADFTAEYGHPCLVHCGDGLGGGYILVSDVLPRALAESGNVEAASILAAAAKTDIPVGGTPQGFGAKFAQPGSDNVGDNIGALSFIMQWQGGELKVVWPADFAVDEPIFPMPTWSER